MQLGHVHIDFDAYQITGPAGDYTVEPKVMEVLSVLLENAGQVVTRESLIDQVWGVGHGGDERLSRAISLLRKALGDTRGQHNFIQTIPKRGYKLIAESDVLTLSGTDETGDLGTALSTPSHNKGREERSKARLAVIIAAAMLALAALIYIGKTLTPASPGTSLVMVMDSAHPARIYDEDVKAAGGTNADILSDILADLPIRTQKELISPSWHRHEAVKQFRPDLIVIHYSGFKQEDASGDRPQLRFLIEYFQKSETKFLIYSRASRAWLDKNTNAILENLFTDDPGLKDRVSIFPLMEYGEPYWKDPKTAQAVKLKIKDILELK